MPEPEAHPHLLQIKRVTYIVVTAAVVITLLKFVAFAISQSVAVLSDALESIINVVAAAMMAYTIRMANRPPSDKYPYGHGKIEFLAIGVEACMILVAGVVIAVEAVRRLLWPPDEIYPEWGIGGLTVVMVATIVLAIYTYRAGRKYDSQVLLAHGKHLITDACSTIAVLVGLGVVYATGNQSLDPIIAIIIAVVILGLSWRMLWQSLGGLMDRSDPNDDKLITSLLNEAVNEGLIRGYHKVRHRHQGPFHWVDMHLQVDEHLSVRESHELASKIERRIESALGQGNATAHVEPWDEHYHEAPARDDGIEPLPD